MKRFSEKERIELHDCIHQIINKTRSIHTSFYESRHQRVRKYLKDLSSLVQKALKIYNK